MQEHPSRLKKDQKGIPIEKKYDAHVHQLHNNNAKGQSLISMGNASMISLRKSNSLYRSFDHPFFFRRHKITIISPNFAHKFTIII